jgi:hypothetical protein
MRTLSGLGRFQNAKVVSLLQFGGVSDVTATSQAADLELNIGATIQPPIGEPPN